MIHEIRMEYLLNNVGMLDAFQEGDLSDCGTGNSIVFLLQLYFLQGNDLNK